MALNCYDCGNSWSFWSYNWDVGRTHFSGSSTSDSMAFSEAVNDDIVDRLPADPFGMEMALTAIQGWYDFGSDFCVFDMQDGDEKKLANQQHLFKGFNWVCNGSMSFQEEEGNSSFYGFGSENANRKIVDQSPLVKGLNWVMNGSMSFHEEGNFETNEVSIPNDDFNGFRIDNGFSTGGFMFNNVGIGLEDRKGVFCDGSEGVLGSEDCKGVFCDGSGGVLGSEDCKGVFCDGSEGDAPNDALFFTLGYLSVKDLLAVEMVCRSLRDAVRNDPLLWRRIQIDQSLNKRFTDDALLKLTSRAQGTLECLSLVGCASITDDGLRRVFESNHRLRKLSVPDCTRLTVEGLLYNLRAFRSTGSLGIKHLRLGRSFGVTEEQFEEFKFLLGVDNPVKTGVQKPQFYSGHSHRMCDDDRAIDIDVCPRCQKVKLVFDCPSESCKKTRDAGQMCRACLICIMRCIRCGCCFKDCDYEETFTLDFLCFYCFKQILNSEEKPEVVGDSSSKHAIIHQERRYQLCFYR